jgi:putative transposase
MQAPSGATLIWARAVNSLPTVTPFSRPIVTPSSTAGSSIYHNAFIENNLGLSQGSVSDYLNPGAPRRAGLINWEFPRLCRGGSRSLMFPRVCPGYPLMKLRIVSRQSTRIWSSINGRVRKPKLNHSKWDCNYQFVFIPKCRRKTLYVQLRQYLGEVFRKLAEQKESRIEEGHLMPDHVHMMISIPPKYAVSQVIGFINGKSAIHLARVYGENRRNFVGQSFWARGYFVSTVGRDEEVIRNYIRNQEQEDKRLEQMNLWR